MYTLGRAEYGRLGLGENCGEKKEPTHVKLDGKCTAIAASNSVSFALMEDGRWRSYLKAYRETITNTHNRLFLEILQLTDM